MTTKQRIRIYNGGGALPMCSNASLFMLSDIFAKEVAAGTLEISAIDHFELRSKTAKWQDDTALLVFSGGGVTGFKDALKDDGLSAIKSYVSQGGCYLGMCAGAYFGAAEIDFTGHDWQTKKPYKRQSDGLGFFDGLAKGSVDEIAPLYDGTSATCRAINVTLENPNMIFHSNQQDKNRTGQDNTAQNNARKFEQASVFYGGGPEFLMPAQSPLTEAQIISRYLLDNGETCVAGLSCSVTNDEGLSPGNAVLLSWHADLNAKFIKASIKSGMPDPGANRLSIAQNMDKNNNMQSPAVNWLGNLLRKQIRL